MGPTVRGFRIETPSDNTLYLVCVITRGSSYNSEQQSSQLFTTDDAESSDSDIYEDESDNEIFTDLDNQFYVMPLEWTRNVRDVTDQEEQDADEESSSGFDITSFFPSFGSSDGDGSDDDDGLFSNSNSTLDYLAFPSTNDTELLVTKPTVVNLGSQSSKCIQIRTPPDPAKLSLIDNKRMSVMIGCGMGLLVFIGIVISIVTAKNDSADDEDYPPPENSISGSHKSPRQENANETIPASNTNRRSRTSSISSSIATRLLEQEGNSSTAVARIKRGDKVPGNESGTLSRKSIISRQDSREESANKKIKKRTKYVREKIHSTADSRRSSSDESSIHEESNRRSGHHSRHNSDEYINKNSRKGQQSWQGTPRNDFNGQRRRRRSGYEEVGAEHPDFNSTTFPRRSNEPNPHHRFSGPEQLMGAAGSGMSLDTGMMMHPSNKRLFSHPNGSSSSIPLMEYHMVDATMDPPVHNRGTLPPGMPPHFGSRNSNNPYARWNGARPKMAPKMPNHVDQNQDYFPNKSPLSTVAQINSLAGRLAHGSPPTNNRPFVKYNSFANY